ncbi:MAG: GAF domain-containing protein, partial [Thermoflexus sp.]
MAWLQRLRWMFGCRSPYPSDPKSGDEEGAFLERWGEPLMWMEADGGRLFLNAAARAYVGDPVPSSRRDLESRLQPPGILERWLRGSREPALIGQRRTQARVLPLTLDGRSGYLIILQPIEGPTPAPEPSTYPRELALVTGIARLLSASLDLESTLDAILFAIRQVIPYDLAEINLWEPGERRLRTRARGGDPQAVAWLAESGGVYRPEEGLTGWLATHRRPLLIEDLRHFTEARPRLDLERFPARAFLGVPMQTGEEFIGTLELAAYRAGAFTNEHLRLLEAIAAQAAIAIHNVRLYEATRHYAEGLEVLFRIAAMSAVSPSLPDFLRQSVAELAGWFRVERVVVLLYDPKRQELAPHPAGLYGPWPPEAMEFRLSVQDPVFAASVFRTGRPFRSNRASEDRRVIPPYRELIARFGVRSVLSIPLIPRERPIGEIHLINRREGRFTPDDERLGAAIGVVLGTTLHNLQLIEQAQRRAARLRALVEIGQRITATLDLDEIFETIREALGRILDAHNFYAALYDRESDEVSFVFY